MPRTMYVTPARASPLRRTRCDARGGASARVASRADSVGTPRAPLVPRLRGATRTAIRVVPSGSTYETGAAKAMIDVHAEAAEGTASSSRGFVAAPSVAYPQPPEKYVPSPVDAGAFTGQIVAFVFIAIAVGYVQVVLNPTAKARFNASDEDKRAYLKELFASENQPGDVRRLERWYYRRVILASGLRPRGDQTEGGTVVPGLKEQHKRGTREPAGKASEGEE